MPVGQNKPVTLDADNIRFDIYDGDDIHQFSVCKITNSVSFNSIGSPGKYFESTTFIIKI